MSLKAKLISTISAFVLILTIVIVGVWAASTANISLGGTVNFQATNVYAKVSATVSGMDENPTLPTLIFSEGEDASPETNIEKWNNLNLVFNTSGNPIEIEVTVENLSDERSLGVSIQNQIASIENIDISITSEGEASTSATLSPSTGSGTSTVTFLVTVSLQNSNVSVIDAIYDILITLTDESQMKQINVYSNDPSLGSVSGAGLYAPGSTVTLSASPEDGKTFLAWATSTDPNEMEIVSTSPTYSFEFTEDSPTTYFALFNKTTSTGQTVGYLKYTFYNDAKLASVTDTTSLTVSSRDFTIPSVVKSGENSYKVYSIGDSAFRDCNRLTSISIPKGVTSIGYRAFYNCSLTSVSLPSTLTSIGDSAFYNCKSLTSIRIPEGVTEIGNYAFYNCKSLTSITLPSTLTSIDGSSNFSNLSSLMAFYGDGNEYYRIDKSRALLVDGGKTLLAYARANTATSYTIPEGVTEIGNYAFYGCSNLTSVSLPSTLTSIGEFAFAFCENLTSITIPEGVTSIGYRAFYNCSSLAEISINGNIINIGSDISTGAFRNCPNLTKLTLGSNVTSLPDSLFGTDNLTNLTEIVVEAGSTLSAALPTYGTWVKGGGDTVTNFSGAGTYTRTDV